MSIRIVNFEIEHLEQIDLRDHEATIDYDMAQLKEMSVESKTAFVNDEIICCWGVFDNHGLWQLPSKQIKDNPMMYGRRALKVVREMIRDLDGAHSLCLADDLHDRWMRFLGFKANPEKQYEIQGHNYIMYEVA